MANRYSTTEIEAIHALLKTQKRNSTGILPYYEWVDTPEWKLLLQRHKEPSLRQKLLKEWKNSIIPIKAEEKAPAQEVAKQFVQKSVTSPPTSYNYCPHCGNKL